VFSYVFSYVFSMCSLLKQGLCVLLCVLLCVFYVFSSEAGLNGSTYVFSTPPLTNVFSFVFSSEAGLNVSATQQLHRIIVENEIDDLITRSARL
jgi:hypothetical protein